LVPPLARLRRIRRGSMILPVRSLAVALSASAQRPGPGG
jgi:hypothetical protein